MGYRFRLHRKHLPGNPDLVFPRLRKKIIFVHGCSGMAIIAHVAHEFPKEIAPIG